MSAKLGEQSGLACMLATLRFLLPPPLRKSPALRPHLGGRPPFREDVLWKSYIRMHSNDLGMSLSQLMLTFAKGNRNRGGRYGEQAFPTAIRF